MIRPLLISLLFAAPAAAQTPAHISAANELRICLWEEGGLRSAHRAHELQRGIDRFRSENIWTVTDTGPGTVRVTRVNPSGMTAEIKLPDDTGAAYCLLFGPSLQPGDAARAADTFVEFGFMPGLTRAEPTPGIERRYVAQGLPFTLELIAYRAEGFGEIVGLTFQGLNNAPESRQLTAGRSDVSAQNVQAFAAWALETCVRNLSNQDWMRNGIEHGGFIYGWPDGGNTGSHVYFLPDNALSVTVGSHTCEIATNYMGAVVAFQTAKATLDRAFPGVFRADRASHSENSNCQSLFGRAGNLPLIVNVENLDTDARRSCFDDGTSQIWFEVPG